VIYTQILSLSNLPAWQHYLYLALYNTLYMADDIIVFIIAAKTLNFVQLNHKYDRAMKLVGGLLIIVLGLILIFRPELLA
jgi:cytochrome c biogenesis protein CcdA